ncbi:MAG: hypothetical protein NZ777_09485, partial [Pseudomonadales bacterium]|nr:hypothetical protein [Pseudomonadales bacterium]
MNFFRRKWVIEVIGIVAVSGLIWFVGPLVAIGGNVPLETESSRWLLILTVIVLWALNILRRYLVARRNNQKMIEDLSALESSETLVSDTSEDEIEILNKDFKEALGILKESRSKGLQGLQYL